MKKKIKHKGDKYFKIASFFYNIASFFDAIAHCFISIGDKKNG